MAGLGDSETLRERAEKIRNVYASLTKFPEHAPGVQFTGPGFVGEIRASDAAVPTLVIRSGSDVRIPGGDLEQANGAAVRVKGLTPL